MLAFHIATHPRPLPISILAQPPTPTPTPNSFPPTYGAPLCNKCNGLQPHRYPILSVASLPKTNAPHSFPIPNKQNHLTSTPDEFYVISMVTRMSSNRRRGLTSMLAMLYLTLFATLAVGFYVSTNTSAQVSSNEQRRYKSLGAAESGMDFMRYQLFQ